ncbi:MAG: diaminopimelate decarboxylase, partial [Propionibacteriaceae bacterium]|nr:diaminopimelate decarboxylase [Propionibacteriaceae bacterium]
MDAMSFRPEWLTPQSDANRPVIWPVTASRPQGVLTIGGLSATDMVREFGTPLYVMDEADFRARATAFREAFAPWQVYYAGKSFLTRTIARWAVECGLGVDVCSITELTTALQGGVPPRLIALHGNNKSNEELELAVEQSVGRIVIDAEDEIDRLARIVASRPAEA